jgi:hypothetical protein
MTDSVSKQLEYNRDPVLVSFVDCASRLPMFRGKEIGDENNLLRERIEDQEGKSRK